MPGITWRERVGDIPRPGDATSRSRGRPTFSLAGPKSSVFSTPEYLPTGHGPNRQGRKERERSSSLHKFPFRAPSANPTPFEPLTTSPQRPFHRSGSANSRVSHGLDVDLARKASVKGPGTPRDVQLLMHQVEGAIAARLDLTRPGDEAAVMRRVEHIGLRPKYVDRGRKSTAPARAPLPSRNAAVE